MYRFLLTRRWLAFALFVVALAAVCLRLGAWQFDRLDERQARNEVTRHNLSADPVDLTDVAAAPGSTATSDPDDEWRQVEVRGTYDPDHQIVVKYQTRENHGPGVEIVTPLVTADGTAVLVDRGWVASANTAASPDDVPEPVGGEVEVVGWWRADSTAETSAVVPDDGQVRAISSAGIAESLPYAVYAGGYLALESQRPGDDALLTPTVPDLGQGPHFFYGLQWWFFALLALVGFVWFAWSEAHPRPGRTTARGPRPSAGPPATSERAGGSPVDREHHAGEVRSGG
ncbi:cytochrome oxidase assembly protein ShyY1 [Mumia flava]|uniref:SURF1-like protein n=1 Tax=Mumia flava TaxID=1348852 RepID=A0A2M9B6H9_9ACTN|nr:SURF1 family protein [Mumia flava]PJJ53561.1 cytochrome oxidase assembly protein ShyY1 [Mumia flava]